MPAELIKNLGDVGLIGVMSIFLYILWKHHTKTVDNHREDHKATTKNLMEVVNQNTESNTKLSDAVNSLKEFIKGG